MICSSGIGFDPIVDEQRLTFGFHGIWQGTAVLYDKETNSHWYHLSGECFEGPLKGTVLRRIRSGRHTTWGEWIKAHPNTDVIAPESKYVGRLGDGGYFPRDSAKSGRPHMPAYFVKTWKTRDARFEPHTMLYGVRIGDHPRGYLLEHLRETGVIEEVVHAVPVTIWFRARGRTVAAFDRRARGKTLHFQRLPDGRFQDRETVSTWDMEGQAVRGPLKGTRLTSLHGLLTEWYGWYAHYPTTTMYAP